MDISHQVELPSHEVLSQLVKDDPQAYEALRREVIESFIGSAPARLKPRLNGIQFRVDCLRRLSRSSALGATVRIYNLMWESFLSLNDHWQEFALIQQSPNNSQGLSPSVNGASRSLPARASVAQRAKILVLHRTPDSVCGLSSKPIRNLGES